MVRLHQPDYLILRTDHDQELVAHITRLPWFEQQYALVSTGQKGSVRQPRISELPIPALRVLAVAAGSAHL